MMTGLCADATAPTPRPQSGETAADRIGAHRRATAFGASGELRNYGLSKDVCRVNALGALENRRKKRRFRGIPERKRTAERSAERPLVPWQLAHVAARLPRIQRTGLCAATTAGAAAASAAPIERRCMLFSSAATCACEGGAACRYQPTLIREMGALSEQRGNPYTTERKIRGDLYLY